MKTCLFQGKKHPVLGHGTNYKCHTIVTVLTLIPQRHTYPSLSQGSAKALGVPSNAFPCFCEI